MAVPVLIMGDTLQKIRVTCKDAELGTVIDLTGVTVRWRYSLNGGTVLNRPMTVLAPAIGGQAEYQIESADLIAVGQIVSQFEITSGTRVGTSTDDALFSVQRKL